MVSVRLAGCTIGVSGLPGALLLMLEAVVCCRGDTAFFSPPKERSDKVAMHHVWRLAAPSREAIRPLAS